MKKKVKLILMIIITLIIGACNKVTMDEERTIILEVDSQVIPTFTSNFGTGSYDASTGKYTHTISSIKDLYITLSYNELKSLTVYIPTSEMDKEIITKNVEFGQKLDAEVEVTVEGVKTLEGIDFETNPNVLNLKLGKKNTFTFTLPSRDKDEEISFSIPGYKPFEISISKDLLVSGKAKLSTIALHFDQMYIALEGNEYSYEIYSSSTNELLASGSKYSYDENKSYILLPSNDSYYMNVNYHNTYITQLYKINGNENFTLDGSLSLPSYGYLSIDPYKAFSIYDKVNKSISHGTMTNTINYLGLLIEREENELVYIDNIIATNQNQDYYNYYYQVDYSQAVPVQFHVTRIHTFTNEVISSEIESDFYPWYENMSNVELNDNIFYVTIYENESYELSINVYDDNNQVVGAVPYYIGGNFNSTILRGTILYNGQKIPYQFPLYKNDIEYNDGTYTYIGHPVVDTNISLVEIIYMSNTGDKGWLSDNAYITGPDGLPILRTDTGENKIYFELKQDIDYTLHNNTKTYKFTLTETDLALGQVVVWDDAIKFGQVKIPSGYHIVLPENVKLYPNSDNIVRVPLSNKNSDAIYLSNGFATFEIQQELSETQLLELPPFYVLDSYSYLIDSSSDYEVYYQYGTNNQLYYYINPINQNYLISTNICTNLNEIITLEDNDFEYNQTLKAKYYSFAENSLYILNRIYLVDYSQTEFINIDNTIYILNGKIISFNNNDYDLSTYGSKKLNLQPIDDGFRYYLQITPQID